MQSVNDARRGVFKTLTLIGGRSGLLMFEASGGSGTLQVRARLPDGQTLGPIPLDDPAGLPGTDGGNAKYSTTKYSATLPPEWIWSGSELEVSRSDASNAVKIPLTVGPPIAAVMRTWPIFLYGAKPAASKNAIDLEAHATAGVSWAREYLQRMPFSSLTAATAGSMEFGVLPSPPSNNAGQCHPAIAFRNETEIQGSAGHSNGYYSMNQLLQWSDVLRGMPTANSEAGLLSAYWMPMEHIDVNNQQSTSIAGGLAFLGGTSGAGDQDNYAGVFFHELGHGFGLDHTADMYAAGDYPYQNGSLAGSAWGYDADRKMFLSTLWTANAPRCGGLLASDGRCYKNDPMNGGQWPLDSSRFKWGNFSDYSMAIMQGTVNGKAAQYDPAFPGKVRQWNAATRSFVAYSGDVLQQKLWSEMAFDQQVVSVVGSVSHFNVTPLASRIFVGAAGRGNQPRLFDPTVQDDMDFLKTLHQSNGRGYCVVSGCDYTLEVTYADRVVRRVLLPMGYNSDAGVAAAVVDPLNAFSFARYAVNLPVRADGIVGVKLFRTPLGRKPAYIALAASDLGTPAFPLMNQWSVADGAMGGRGGDAAAIAPDMGKCAQGAIRYAGPL